MKKDTSYSLRGKICEEKVSILNIYARNARAPKFITETFLKLKTHIELHIITVGYFYTPISPMDSTLKQKVKKDSEIKRGYEPN